MKYIKTYESYKNYKNIEPVNEELLAGIINWFKNLWNKAIAELEKLGKNPKDEDIDKWLNGNIMNPADDTFVLKQQLDDFKKKPEANDQDCLTLIDSILNPETGALGKQGLQPMLDALNKKYPPKKGETMHWIPATIQWTFNTIRTKAIVQYKFAGGPTDGKVDPKKINIDLKDTTHLPDLKKLLTAAPDGKKKKEVTITWVEKTLVPQLNKYINELKDEDQVKYLQSIKVTPAEDVGPNAMTYQKIKEFFDKKVPVIYKLEAFNQEEWDKLTDEQKKNPKEDPANKYVGVKVINAINDQNTNQSVTFLDKNEQPNIKKGYTDILGPAAGNESDEQKKAAESLGKIKNDPVKMTKVAQFADFLQDEANKDKIAEIDKILGGGGEAAGGAAPAAQQ